MFNCFNFEEKYQYIYLSTFFSFCNYNQVNHVILKDILNEIYLHYKSLKNQLKNKNISNDKYFCDTLKQLQKGLFDFCKVASYEEKKEAQLKKHLQNFFYCFEKWVKNTTNLNNNLSFFLFNNETEKQHVFFYLLKNNPHFAHIHDNEYSQLKKIFLPRHEILMTTVKPSSLIVDEKNKNSLQHNYCEGTFMALLEEKPKLKPENLDTLVILKTEKNYLETTTTGWEEYWKNFSNNYFEKFCLQLENKNLGLLTLPSNVKVNKFTNKFDLQKYIIRKGLFSPYGNKQVKNRLLKKNVFFNNNYAMQAISSTDSITKENLEEIFYLNYFFLHISSNSLKLKKNEAIVDKKNSSNKFKANFLNLKNLLDRFLMTKFKEEKDNNPMIKVLIYDNFIKDLETKKRQNFFENYLKKKVPCVQIIELKKYEICIFPFLNSPNFPQIKKKLEQLNCDYKNRYKVKKMFNDIENKLQLLNIYSNFMVELLDTISRRNLCLSSLKSKEQVFINQVLDFYFYYLFAYFFIYFEQVVAKEKKLISFATHISFFKMVRTNILLKKLFFCFQPFYNQIKENFENEKKVDLKIVVIIFYYFFCELELIKKEIIEFSTKSTKLDTYVKIK